MLHQRNYEQAIARALAAARRQPAEQLQWLGATEVPEADMSALGSAGAGRRWKLAVLDDVLTVDLEAGAVFESRARAVGLWWRVLTLHYLSVQARPRPEARTVTFAQLVGGRGYAAVYHQRVIERLCRTVGRDRETLSRAAARLPSTSSGREPVELGREAAPDLLLEFQAYPRVRLHLAWYAGDEELPPSAALLLPGNIEAFFCLEDIVVLSERLVARLAGGRF